MKKKLENSKKDTKIYDFAATNESLKVLEHFETDLNGLREDEIESSREKYGNNIITVEKEKNIFYKLIESFLTPFTVVLIFLSVISFFTDYMIPVEGEKSLTSVIIIVIMILISSFLTFSQSLNASKAAEKLVNIIKVTAAVKREGNSVKEIETNDIVCGDIIYLSAGDMIPADMRLLTTKDLFISQSSLTGESYPVEKFAEIEKESKDVSYYKNIAFMGTNVISGTGKGVVISVGDNAFLGQLSKNISRVDKKNTSFDAGVANICWLLIKLMVVMDVIIFLINGITKKDWFSAFLFSVPVAVGLTPEMLPMIVTTNLVKGSKELAKKGSIVKNLSSINNFGAIDVLCTDKTGTLTQDKIVLEYHLNTEGIEDTNVLKHAFLNSYYQTGLTNLMDIAIIEATNEELNIDVEDYKKIDEIPFDFQRRRMSVIIKDKYEGEQIITKGAVEEMLQISSYVHYKGEVISLSKEIKKDILYKVSQLNSDGMRVIAVAHKINLTKNDEFTVKDEKDMILLGYLAFLDPPKETASKVIKSLNDSNVSIKVLTGDNEFVTRSICRQVGLDVIKLISGFDLDSVSESEFLHLVEENNIFVKLSPQHKIRIVNALKSNGHTVGFLGDGINDAPAMNVADVGISVDTAVDISKESADIILLEKDLMILDKGIILGRTIFGNIIKYIKITASSNFGNILSILMASLFLPFLPMLPLQILFLGLIYDISCISIPWDSMDKEYIEKPKYWSTKSLTNFIISIGPISTIFDIITFLFLFFIVCPLMVGGSFGSLTASQQHLFIIIFHTGWFLESLWTQTLVIHALRTPKIPFIQSRASFAVLTITSLGVIVGTWITNTFIGVSLGMCPMPLYYYVYLVIISISYIIVISIIKKIYIRKYGYLL